MTSLICHETGRRTTVTPKTEHWKQDSHRITERKESQSQGGNRILWEHIESESPQKDCQSLEWTSHRWRGWGFFTNRWKSLNAKKKRSLSSQPVFQVARCKVFEQKGTAQEEELGPEERPHMVTGDWEFSSILGGKNKKQNNPQI